MAHRDKVLSEAMSFLLNWTKNEGVTPMQKNCDVCGRLAYLVKKEIPGGRHREVCGGCAPGIDKEIEEGQYDDEE